MSPSGRHGIGFVDSWLWPGMDVVTFLRLSFYVFGGFTGEGRQRKQNMFTW